MSAVEGRERKRFFEAPDYDEVYFRTRPNKIDAKMLRLPIVKSLTCPVGAETMQILSIKLPDETLHRLHTLAKQNHNTVEGLVETLLEDYADTDEARLAEYERTGHGISHEIAMAWLQDLAEGQYRPCPK